jgi:hypothetical protein
LEIVIIPCKLVDYINIDYQNEKLDLQVIDYNLSRLQPNKYNNTTWL